VRRHLPIFLPQQTQRDAFTPQFLMHLRPLWRRLWHRRRRFRHAQQSFQDLFLGPFLGKGPGQVGGLGPLEVVPNRTGRNGASAGDFPNRQLVLVFESQDFFDLTHGFGLACHWLPFSV